VKIKSDFITNSSSSSFIVAIKSDVTRDKLQSIIAGAVYDWMNGQDEEVINDMLSDQLDPDSMSDAKKTQLILEKVGDAFFDISSHPVKISEWDIYAGECGNEGDWFSSFLYDMSAVNTENFKFKKFY